MSHLLLKTWNPGGKVRILSLVLMLSLGLILTSVASADQKEKPGNDKSRSKPAAKASAKDSGRTAEKSADKKSAEKKPADKKSTDKKRAAKIRKPARNTADRKARVRKAIGDRSFDDQELAVLTFAREHHTELADLLSSLKEANPREYRDAIHDLFRTTQRLNQIRKRFPERYDLELTSWKLKSQIRLLAARLTMGPDPDLEQELRKTLEQQLLVERQLMQLEREDLARRLKKLDAAIETSREHPDQQLDRQFDKLMRKVRKDKENDNRS